MKKLVTIIAAIAITILGINFIPAPAHAVTDICSQSGVSADIRKANGCDGDTVGFDEAIVGILNGVVGVLGAIAAIFIVVGGVSYMTSQGDPGKTKKAKDTILYALIGLVVAVLAFAIVNFVVVNILRNNSGSSNDNGNGNTVVNGGGAV